MDVALMFPGQGSQYPRMAASLYGTDAVFTSVIDEVFELFGEVGSVACEDWLAGADIDHVSRAQPLLFAVDYALGRTVLSWGVEPVALIGHSAGEVVAATLAGVFSLEEAVSLVRDRVLSAVPIPSGGMLAAAASEADLLPYLEGDVAIAAVNSARQTMLAGSDEPLARVRARLEADEYIVVTVPASTPFHSPAMQPAVDEALASWSASPRAPRMPLYSGYTGKLMTPQDALSARFWTRQLTDAVYFGPALNELVAMYDVLLVEAGPGQTLTSFARRTKAVRSGASQVLPLLDSSDTVDAARARLV
ncbi:Acyl transferase domain-containing protein [Lentzea albidocapillata subsp. violacea]|uniref:Acyl transferase domain-containing protein n=1 Tax=Lentzea albidocapillata subsp. violacea TaxID=128104 RepID=A0A1G9BCH2_9PSEU|nr:acyltransferase domain-containing protein [Lentzea albidocapillata]SDK36565.1 Acyl transferase domain-containing protein [Lentzea albidocapillata subsp. violacea]